MKYKKPIYTADECILKKKTYGIPLYIPVQIKHKNKLITDWDINSINLIKYILKCKINDSNYNSQI